MREYPVALVGIPCTVAESLAPSWPHTERKDSIVWAYLSYLSFDTLESLHQLQAGSIPVALTGASRAGRLVEYLIQRRIVATT